MFHVHSVSNLVWKYSVEVLIRANSIKYKLALLQALSYKLPPAPSSGAQYNLAKVLFQNSH
jgi:hypothetical protein